MDASSRLSDTFSNVAYAIAGGVVLYLGGAHAIDLAVGLFFLTIVSAAYHATDTDFSRHLDECGMYGALVPLCFAAIGKATVVGMVEMRIYEFIAFGALFAYHLKVDSFKAVGVLAGVALLSIRLFGGDIVFGGIALGLFLIALLVRARWHWLWHVGTACAFVSAYYATI